MPEPLPVLRDRRGFDAWKKALPKALTPEEWKSLHSEPPNSRFEANWLRWRISAYETMVHSIHDSILNGLIAHGCLGPEGDPSALRLALCKWLEPSSSHTAQQVKKLLDADTLGLFRYPETLVPYVQFIKISVDYNVDNDSPTLTALLLDTLRKIPTYRHRVEAYPEDIGWYGVMQDLSGNFSERIPQASGPRESNKRIKSEE
ncbi:hypothetical protein CkaCkLH20_09170 [Colletotrichum karsti]|uniref:Uncharacterized protein n=1 Tax=Colletotrichum karsti TaxID=1095194 RepID=A0A9P6HY18_9PEZI|nr:uncharacterized protein CkaCkLH20_09170 [Colletotrichum karsti]KAF9873357.1 hypothetical protein CkaCkLH20_09170 [Colletotrichum karsti]